MIPTPKLDLHGVVYADVPQKIDRLVFRHKPPYRIITGNSFEMQKQVLTVLGQYSGMKAIVNIGSILVIEE